MLEEFWWYIKWSRNYSLICSKTYILNFNNSRKTVNKFGKNTTISVKGRHDPCVGIRAVPVGEAMMNCVLLDHYLNE